MKLFYKKDYLRVKEELEELTLHMAEAMSDIETQKESIGIYEETVETMHYKMEDMKKEIKQLKGGKGGFTREINKLKKEKEELEKKLAESMTDKYLVRKIKSGKTANTLKTKVRSSSIQSNIVKNLHKN